jgi:DnaK suppressor protein
MIFQKVILDQDYNPKADNETYMNIRQKSYFYNALLEKEKEIQEEIVEIKEGIEALKQVGGGAEDIDNAGMGSELEYYFKTLERNESTLKQIKACIESINNGKYGYCERTNQKIGLDRLLANPLARLSLASQKDEDLKLMARPFESDPF